MQKCAQLVHYSKHTFSDYFYSRMEEEKFGSYILKHKDVECDRTHKR